MGAEGGVTPAARRVLLRASALAAAAFGGLTIQSGGAVLFGPPEAAQATGHVVPFVLWFNFLAGFAYLAAATGLWLAARWGAWTATAIAAATALVFALLGLAIASGAAYEMRTVSAMALRTGFWAVVAALAWALRPRLVQGSSASRM